MRRAAAALGAALLVLALGGIGGSASATPAAAPSAASFLRASLVRHLGPHAAGAATASRSEACTAGSGVLCSTVVVPLDRTGVVPGTVSLHVEEVPAQGTPRGAIFLIAGGPGQGSAHVFGLDNAQQVSFYRFLFPGYTLVAYDDRGTGDSGLIDCQAIQQAVTADQEQAGVAACANQLGPARDFYSTMDHAQDLDAVRAALGLDKIGLFGVSYGTKLALAYALAFPQHVERLLLVSVLPTNEPDPFQSNVLKGMPATLNAFCSDGGCKSATSNFAADVAAEANIVAAKPVHGTVVVGGKSTKVTLDGLQLLSAIIDADLNPGLAAELPAAVHAARQGNTQPLLRLLAFDEAGNQIASIDLSGGLNVATNCHDGPFPWSPDTPVDQRQAIEQDAISKLPAGSLGPFGSWAARFGPADTCLVWPSPAGGGAFGAGPLPNVPMLAISGGFDMRTPTADAAAITAQFPQGHLLVVPGVGHDALDADYSACAARAVNAWMTGAPVPSACPRSKPLVPDTPALPVPGNPHPKVKASATSTLLIVTKTVQEAETAWLMANGDSISGIFGGRLVPVTPETFRLVNYSDARGITVNGTIKAVAFGPPFSFQGTLTVGGPRAQPGLLGLRGSRLSGTLGGRLFR